MLHLSRRLAVALALCLTSLFVFPGTSWAQAIPGDTDAGRSFEPTPATRPEFGVKSPPAGCMPQRNPSVAPEAECGGQKRFVVAGDGANIYVETYLPKTIAGSPPVPEELPTVLIMTMYSTFDRAQQVERHEFWASYLASRGYAVAIGHEFGTGNSDGCYEFAGPRAVDATAHVIDYLGNSAPWTNGRVGMVGLSADATSQISVATSGDPTLTEPLKAIVPVESLTSLYDWMAFDGVPQGLAVPTLAAGTGVSLLPGDNPLGGQAAGRAGCAGGGMDATVSMETDGSVTPYYAARISKRGAGRVRAATLMVHGLRDDNTFPNSLTGFFERLPEDVPHKLMLGQWGHGWPDRNALREELPRNPWERVDFPKMVQAWFDRFLMGLDTGVEGWPEVQVQDSNGQWRAERDWPVIDGTFGQLALGFYRGLRPASLDGNTTFWEIPSFETRPISLQNSQVLFTTPALDGDLRLSGQPVLDLSVRLRNPDGSGDAHIAASLEAYGPTGERLAHAPVYGARSLQHLEPMPNGYFEQPEPEAAPLDEPIRVAIRLMPTDLVVPAGGHLELRVGAANPVDWPYQMMPSGTRSEVEILHSCEHASVLRFLMPRPDADLLNVRESHEAQYPEGALPSDPSSHLVSVDGGGLASSSVCGSPPIDPQTVITGDVHSLEATALTLSYERQHGQALLRARLTEADSGEPLSEKTINFLLNGSELGSVVTDDDGTAELSLTKKMHRGDVATAIFLGDTSYEKTQAELIVP